MHIGGTDKALHDPPDFINADMDYAMPGPKDNSGSQMVTKRYSENGTPRNPNGYENGKPRNPEV